MKFHLKVRDATPMANFFELIYIYISINDSLVFAHILTKISRPFVILNDIWGNGHGYYPISPIFTPLQFIKIRIIIYTKKKFYMFLQIF